VNTLEMMAFAARKKTSTVLCPMIDARRMEVFTAIFNSDLGLISPPCSMVLDTGSFSEELDTEPITFFGNGSGKWQKVCEHRNAVFLDVKSSASDLAELSYKRFELNEFADLAYAEPYYGKAFYSPPPKPSV
jgi:tRNA threonylcarbamoyladenosine biosynthesis protein TsaB